MNDFGEIQESPEILSAVMVIKTLGETKDQMKKNYDEGKFFRWTYDQKNFILTVWPYVNEDVTPDHIDVDKDAKRLGNVGYYNKGLGMHGHIPGIDKIIKEAVEIVLEKYFK